MKICLVNMSIIWKNKKENLLSMEKHIQKARNINAEIDTIVFPELGCIGYVLDYTANEHSENMKDYCVKETQLLAKKYKINIISGFLEKNNNDNKPYNTIFAVNKVGKLVGKYRKNHLYSESDEINLYSKGEELNLFNFDDWRCGMAICFDIRFPRLFESLANAGAEIIFIPFNWTKGKNKFEMLKIYTQARAGENQIYCAAVDRIGKDPYFEYTGSWILSDPIGNDVSTTYDEIYHIGEIKKEKIKEIRKKLPLKPSFKKKYICTDLLD